MKLSDIGIGIAINLASSVLYSLVAWVVKHYSIALNSHKPRFSSAPLSILAILWLVINVTAFVMTFVLHAAWWSLAVAVGVSSGAMFIYVREEIVRYREVGIIGADLQVQTGIDYKSSLRLAQNSLKFLGIGANKLTSSEPDFELAVKRCSGTQPVRLLLLKPSDENLTKGALRANKSEDEYKNLVISSLRKIAYLKTQRQFNIEVKFYRGIIDLYPTFRLMFIDNNLCLVSYNDFGGGDGRTLPQLHVLNKGRGGSSVNSFYYPFDQYFESLWKMSEEWNFSDYL